MSQFKKLASDTALYGISTILARMINFLLAPIQTYAFGKPAELSSNVEFYAYIGVLLALYTLGLETAFFRFAVRNPEQRQRVFNDSLSLVLLVSILPTATIIFLLLTLLRHLTIRVRSDSLSGRHCWSLLMRLWLFRLPGCALKIKPGACRGKGY